MGVSQAETPHAESSPESSPESLSGVLPVDPATAAAAPRPPLHRVRLLAAVLAMVAAALAVAGSFLPLFGGELSVDGRLQLRVFVTGWDFHAEALSGSQADPVALREAGSAPVTGAPLLLASTVLLAAAGVGLSRLRAAPARAATTVAVVLGAGLLVGTAFTIGMQAAAWLSSVRPTGEFALQSGAQADGYLGAGFWLLTAAVVLAVAAAVCALLPSREPPVPQQPPPGPEPG